LKSEEPGVHVHAEGIAHLRTVDPRLAAIIDSVGPCVMQFHDDRFAALVGAIISQQVSSAAAKTMHRRLCELLPDQKPTPEAIAALSTETLRTAGLSGQKAKYLHALAAFIVEGKLDLAALDGMTDDDVAQALVAVPGIGRWTADMFLIFTLQRPDVLPLGDLAVREAMMHHFGLEKGDFPGKAIALAESWRPWRSVACWYFYRDADARKGRAPVV
jgi:DNA-3-methyladenine glycosylase II